MAEKRNAPQRVFCLIVGGGMSGVTMAAHLIRLKVLDYSEFRLVDVNADYGGVWKANTYPGAACDVPSHGYVMRYFLKPDWSRKYAPQAEIQKYYSDIGNCYRLRQSTVFNTKVLSARFNEETLLWEVVTEDRISGQKTNWVVNAIVHAGGQFSRPKYADIPGKELFQGAQWHTAEWNSNYDLTGKRVGIIGTGPSTAQVAPRIQPKVKQLNIYQRSSTYVVPRNDGPIPAWKKRLFTWFPPLLWLYHVWWYFSFETSKQTWLSGTKQNKIAAAYSLGWLQQQVKDPEVRKKLQPQGEFGCKRILVLDDYYPIFNQPNVELITDKPVRITKNGIVSRKTSTAPQGGEKEKPNGSLTTSNGSADVAEEEREIDVLIWGTGFNMSDQGGHFETYGVGGVKLSDVWGDTPQAYYSVAVSKFPNMMLMMGPNAANFWSNLTTLIEIQTHYNCKMVRHLKKQNQKAPYALYVDEQVQNDYNAWIKRSMGNIAILSPNCHNYYTNSKGEATFWNPFHGWYYAWRMMWPKYSDFVTMTKTKPIVVDDLQSHAGKETPVSVAI